MTVLVTRRLALAPDFAWSQSAINDYLGCPRAFYLRFVENRPLDHVASGYAGPLGTAAHAGIAAVLQAVTQHVVISADEVRQLMAAALGAAIQRAQDRGELLDDEGVEGAVERLGELLEWVMALERDRRVRSICWTRVEEKFSWTDRWGRRYQGTIDAAGHARDEIHDFASRGMGESTGLGEGEPIVVDWKTGDVAIDHVARTLNVQLAFYSAGLMRQGAPKPRAFLARLSDINPPKRPKDANGDAIPRTFDELNPAYAKAVGLDPADSHSALEQCKKRPKDAEGNPIPKRITRENPAFIVATSKPRGPVFHECDIDFALATETINDVIRGAESGLFPASGAATGQCLRCPFRRTCLDSTQRGNA